MIVELINDDIGGIRVYAQLCRCIGKIIASWSTSVIRTWNGSARFTCCAKAAGKAVGIKLTKPESNLLR